MGSGGRVGEGGSLRTGESGRGERGRGGDSP